MRVWDRLVRSLHWLLVGAVFTAWISGHVETRWFDEIHHTAGYLAGGVIAARVVWGFIGTPHARFAQFVRGPHAVWRYAQLLRDGHEPRYIGHNPLGGWMVVLLLCVVGAASLTGFLFTTDALWGYEWLANLHAALAWLVLGLVTLHIAGVVLTSLRHGENLVSAMFRGSKRAPAPGDIAD